VIQDNVKGNKDYKYSINPKGEWEDNIKIDFKKIIYKNPVFTILLNVRIP
jgi:hypothetical protein